ncbi:MAG: ABC transporter ATP-binding protein [Planktomarina sp.]
MTHALGITFKGGASIADAPLFAPLTLQIVPRAWTVLLGSSGVGKSTILRLIAGLKTEAVFEGHIIASDGVGIEGRVAYMAQDDLLLPRADVAANVTLGARLRGQRTDLGRVRDLLARVGLADHAAKRPYELSGGQRQRVALARTLMEDKPIVLLDEPFSALDAKTRADMQDLAAELLQGRTVLLVTHDPAEAARLGTSIQIMTQDGLQQVMPPNGMVPRAADDGMVLAAQADLLGKLRQEGQNA